jgi:DNA processing protein
LQDQSLLYKVGLSFIPKIGDITAKRLVSYLGSVEAVFKEKKGKLEKIPGIGPTLSKVISKNGILSKAEAEIEFIIKNKIIPLFYLDEVYPERLKQCEDGPVLLYQKGATELNHKKVLSFVGTRNATAYGREVCEKVIADLKDKGHEVVIVSGLAYGIDVCAHKAALKEGFKTVAVLGHGLNYLYPGLHKPVARKIVDQGCLLSEFGYNEKPEPAFFVRRNRIVAGMADATIVIESGVKGGALITADIANSYNRDVFAVPGNINSPYSKGCNKLIKSNKAALIESANDIEYILGWDLKDKNEKTVQMQLFNDLNQDEQLIVETLKTNGEMPFDHIYLQTKLPVSSVSALLLNLEFSGVIKSLPGKVYKLT